MVGNKYMLDISSHQRTTAIVELVSEQVHFAVVKSSQSEWSVMRYRLVDVKFKSLIDEIYEQWPASLSQKAVAVLESLLCLRHLDKTGFIFSQICLPNTSNYMVIFGVWDKEITLLFEQKPNQLGEMKTHIKVGKNQMGTNLPAEHYIESISKRDFFSFLYE